MICINCCLPYKVVSLYHLKKKMACIIVVFLDKGTHIISQPILECNFMIVYMKKSNAKATKHMKEIDIDYDG